MTNSPGAPHNHVVRESFRNQVGLFSGPNSLFATRAAHALSWIEPLSDEMVVLDVACGAGHASEPLASAVRQVVGIDLTPELLRLGAERLRAAGVENVLLQEGNAEAMPFVDESFDVVFCRASLHHFGNPPDAIAEMMRVCRTGGRVVLNDLVVPEAVDRDVFDGIHRAMDPSHNRTYRERELAELLPGGIDGLAYGETINVRFPIEIALTEQTDRAGVVGPLEAEIRGEGPATGFEPAEEDGQIVVSFTTCTVHTVRA